MTQLFIGHLDQRLFSSKNSNIAMSRHLFYHLALAVKIGMDALAEVEKYMENNDLLWATETRQIENR